jgi:LPXTG-motif cell wall-anchored protein
MRTAVRKSTLDNNDISIAKSVVEGSRYIEDIQIENVDGWAYVVVRFEEDFVSVEAEDISITISLTYHGTKDPDTTVEIFGSLENEIENASDGLDYIYVGDGLVVEADDNLHNVDLDLGNDVHIFANLFSGQKYYAKATDERSDDDEEIVEYYPVIRKVYTLKTVHIKSAGNTVRFKGEDRYYVYDADGIMIGMSDEALPFRDKYYLAVQQIEFDKGVPLAPSEEMVNENPETGAINWNGVLLTGFTLLAAGVIVAGKRRGF